MKLIVFKFYKVKAHQNKCKQIRFCWSLWAETNSERNN